MLPVETGDLVLLQQCVIGWRVQFPKTVSLCQELKSAGALEDC